VREAQRSPFPLSSGGNQLPYGAVTFVSNVQISGWAYDPDVGANPIQVDVFVDGAYLQRIPADKTFAALPNFTGIKDPNHAFTFFPPDVYKDGKTHTAQFFAVNQPDGANPELAGSPASFVGQRNAPPVGWLDAGTATIAAGWAYDPDAGANPIQVEIWIDNVLYKTVTASDNRPDLVPIVAPEPTHGYHADITPALTDGKPHTIRAFALNYPDGPKQELAGSPKELNAQTPWIGAGVQDSSTSGLTVASVDSGSPAQTGGMLQGDVIRSYDGNSLNVDATAFNGWLQTKEIGEQVVFKLYRDPSLFPPAPTPSPAPTPDPQAPPLGPNERLVLVTVGSKGPS